MNKLMNSIKSFMQEEDGVTAIEYGLIAALIAVVIIGSVKLLGGTLDGVFSEINTELTTTGGTGGTGGDTGGGAGG